jgi:hypothetical protein
MIKAARRVTRYNRVCFFPAGLIFLFSFFTVPVFSSEFSPQKAEFSVRVNDLVISYHVMSVFAMPGEKLSIAVNTSSGKKIL